MSAFDVAHPETWPAVLEVAHVAAIYGRTPSAILAALKKSSPTQFNPKPFLRYPARWRKSEIVRHVFGERQHAQLRKVG